MTKRIVKYPDFLTQRHKLDQFYRWKVDHSINNIINHDSINSFIKSAGCEELPLSDPSNYHAINIGKDHTGYEQIKLTVYENLKYDLIAFLDCRKIDKSTK